MNGFVHVATLKPTTELGELTQFANNLTYVYLVGIEGVGHHGVAPAIARIGEACNHNVVFEHPLLRKYQYEHSIEEFQSLLEVSKHVKAPLPNVLVVEDASFPLGKHHRMAPTDAAKKLDGRYDLEWIYDQINAVEDIKVKFLFLSRDFYRSVASHPEFDDSFQQHAEVLHDFLWYIHSEYVRIDSKQPGLWRQIEYEWFTEQRDCQALVTELVAFLELTQCDVDRACASLASAVHKQRAIAVNETERAIAAAYNVDVGIPSLPYDPVDLFISHGHS